MGIETIFTGLGAAAPALQLAGAGLGAVSAYSNSKSAYKAQAQVAQNNAIIAGWQADDALARGDRQATEVGRKTRQLKGRQRAAMAANGVDLGTGSALEILTDTDYFGAIDANATRDNASKEAWAIRNQAQGFTYEAGMAKARAGAESPLLSAGTSLLTSAGRVADRWYRAGGK